jgi:hypothetical protein
MSVAYVIQWKSKVNGRAGRGTKQFDRHEAEQLAQELNREYPDILHEVVKAMPQTEREAEPERESETEMVEADEHVVVE